MALLLAIKTPPTYAWNSLTVFGDSLSDSGNIGRFTYDGNENLLYDEILAHNLGDNLKPSEKGGQNYAQGGATADEQFHSRLNTQEQLTNYLKNRNGHADSNGLYIHSIGANDIAAAVRNPLNAPQIVHNSANSAVHQVGMLLKAGAGVVVVPNVPQLGLTPYIMQMMLSKVDPSALAAAFEVLNKTPTPDNAARLKAIRDAFNAAAEKMSAVSEEQNAIAHQFYDSWKKLSDQVTGLTDSYNNQQESQLGELKGNIARVDIAGLFNEVIANPNQYGLSNTNGIACPLGISSDKCHSSDPGFLKDQNYLFADLLHPSPAVHRMMADYVQSILDAPAQAASLSMSSYLIKQDMQNVLDGHLQQQRIQPSGSGKLTFFGGYASGRIKPDNNEKSTTTNLTVGFGYQLTDNLQSGVIISNDNLNLRASSDFHYKLHGSLAGIYSQLTFLKYGWMNADLHFSSLDYDNIQRTIKIGPALRTEQGKSKGTQTGFRIQSGWDFNISEHIVTGPIASYSLDWTDVKGYSENDSLSTSMRFAKQTLRSQIGSVGWRLESKRYLINPWLQMLYSHQFDNPSYDIRAGLKSTNTSFTRNIKAGDQDWVEAAMGLNVPLGKTFNAFTGISTVASKTDVHPVTWNAGLNATF